MRMTTLVALCLTAAGCGGVPESKRFFDDRPVDGFYRVHITETENTCNDRDLDPDAPDPLVEFYLRDDGLYDVRHDSDNIPGPRSIEDVDRTGGVIDHHLSYMNSLDWDYGLVGTASATSEKTKNSATSKEECL